MRRFPGDTDGDHTPVRARSGTAVEHGSTRTTEAPLPTSTTPLDASAAKTTTTRLVLAGAWRWPHVERLGERFDVWRLDAPRSGITTALRVDWLLVNADANADGVNALLTWLRPGSPGLRLGVVDGVEQFPHAELRIPRAAGPDDIVSALRLARIGFTFGAGRARTAPDQELTERERELLEALCAGLGNDRIARQMKISRSTVEFHLTRIFRKLGVTSRAEAIVQAQRTG